MISERSVYTITPRTVHLLFVLKDEIRRQIVEIDGKTQGEKMVVTMGGEWWLMIRNHFPLTP
jgi:hypothetical protein